MSKFLFSILFSFPFSFLWLLSFSTLESARAAENPMGRIPVQDAGRVKPYDSFARETLRLVFGRENYKGKPAVEVVTTWFLLPDHWKDIEFIQLKRHILKEDLRLDPKRDLFKPNELFHTDRLQLVFQDLDSRTQMKEKLSPYWQDVQRLRNQLGMFHLISSGQAPRIVPPATGETWVSVADLSGPAREKFVAVTKAFPAHLTDPSTGDLGKAVTDFVDTARAINPVVYPNDLAKTDLEIHLNTFHPFQWAWICYLICMLLIGGIWVTRREVFYKPSWIFIVLGFLFHTYGFFLRVYLAGRPPVSNMYETVVWVPWGAVLFGMIFEGLQKKKYVTFASAAVGTLCLILADLAPTILDDSIQPLEPVLRSNLWLTIHVMTITLSYAAFFLALVLGDIGIVMALKKDTKRIADLSLSMYRVLQVGVVLLAAGTILGGVWADYSWGRFWGWDPKETWALIALLGYLAVLHARRGGYVQHFGFFNGAVIAFSLVVMAWYGVNFVLGAGLHSYGFGGGGLPAVATFVGLHFAYSAFAITVYRSRNTSSKG